MLRAKKDSTQKKTNRETAAKAPRNSQATGEAKKLRISLRATARVTGLPGMGVHLAKYTLQAA